MTEPVRIALVVARARNGVIGREGGLPWRMRSDLKWFKEVTMGKPVIMGRKTYESIGKALPGRTNIVVTRSTNFTAPDALIAASVDAAIETARRHADEICIIGGGTIYEQTLALADKIYLTTIEADIEGDTKFPDLDQTAWEIAPAGTITRSDRDDHDARLEVWTRKNP